MTETTPISPLAAIEPQLRSLLPAELYVAGWLDPSPPVLTRIFEHLRTLYRILYDYVPRQVSAEPPTPGQVRWEWQEGALMFADLAGFTRLMEANASLGRPGAERLLGLLNNFFADMIEIVSKSGGDLVEFTGDAISVQFSEGPQRNGAVRAVRAGLRMQRAMERFTGIETPRGEVDLLMRVGIHYGRFLTADIGTPRRMEHVLLGEAVQRAKQAETIGPVGRVCLTDAACAQVVERFRFEPGAPGHQTVIDDLADDDLGEYDLLPPRRRVPAPVLLDRSQEGLLSEVEKLARVIEPLSSYLPASVLELVVASAQQRKIEADFPISTVAFANLSGLVELADFAQPGEEIRVVTSFSRAVALMNAVVEESGGMLKKVTYNPVGPHLLICFGVPSTRQDDPLRAAETALALRDTVEALTPVEVGGKQVKATCEIGLSRGLIFAAEVGEPHGRREYNLLGDALNTAARFVEIAGKGQILVTEAIAEEIAQQMILHPLGRTKLKGKESPVPVFALAGKK